MVNRFGYFKNNSYICKNLKMIIGISGKINSGKDLAGVYLQHMLGLITKYSTEEWEDELESFREEQSGWEIQKFGAPVKDVLCILLGCTRQDLEDRDFKNKQLGQEWWIGDYKPTVRDFMQRVGTEAGRNSIHPNTWINSLMKDYDKNKSKWIITDVRFENELRAIEEKNGIVIRIDNPNQNIDNHSSETSLDSYNFKYRIENNSTKKELYEKLFLFVKNVKISSKIL